MQSIWQSYLKELHRNIESEKQEREKEIETNRTEAMRELRRIANSKELTLKQTRTKIEVKRTDKKNKKTYKGEFFGWAAFTKDGKQVGRLAVLADHIEDFYNKRLSF